MIPVRVDLPKISGPGTVGALVPIIPGGILLLGFLAVEGESAIRFLSTQLLGYYTKILLLIALGYVAGVLLHTVILVITQFVAFLLGYTLGFFMSDRSWVPSPWKRIEWRKVAREYIGERLAPNLDDPYFEENYKRAMEETEKIKDPQARIQKMIQLTDYYLPIQQADLEWYNWYQILTARFSKTNAPSLIQQHLLYSVYSGGWAGLVVLVLAPSIHWLVWALCVFGIALGIVGSIIQFGIWGQDPYGIQLTAEMLRNIKDESTAQPSSEP